MGCITLGEESDGQCNLYPTISVFPSGEESNGLHSPCHLGVPRMGKNLLGYTIPTVGGLRNQMD